MNFIKDVVIEMKVRKQVSSYLAKKLLDTHSKGCYCIGCYLCLFMQTQFQLLVIHECTNDNETYSLTNLQDLIPTYFNMHNYK